MAGYIACTFGWQLNNQSGRFGSKLITARLKIVNGRPALWRNCAAMSESCIRGQAVSSGIWLPTEYLCWDRGTTFENGTKWWMFWKYLSYECQIFTFVSVVKRIQFIRSQKDILGIRGFFFNMIHPVVLYQYIIIEVRQYTQQYLETVILFNIHGYMFRLILSQAIFRPIGYRISVSKILHNFTFNEILCKHNGIPLAEHFIYLNSVTYWPEDGLK